MPLGNVSSGARDDAAADHHFAPVEDDGLAGRDRVLGRLEKHRDLAGGPGHDVRRDPRGASNVREERQGTGAGRSFSLP